MIWRAPERPRGTGGPRPVGHRWRRGLWARGPEREVEIPLCFECIRGLVEVASAEVDRDASTLPNEAVAECIADAVARWTFPKPKSGTVDVRYPFNLSPAVVGPGTSP